MKTLYLECKMGAAGDMLMSALYELMSEEQKQEFLEKMNHLGISDIVVNPTRTESCGISGTHMHVLIHGEEEESVFHRENHIHDHNHTHANLHDHDHSHQHPHSHIHAAPADIEAIIDRMNFNDEVKQNAKDVYQKIADAESKAHGCPVEEIHFHEVGSMDAVVDVTGVCYAISLLKPQKIIVSPVHVGSGTVRCAHGIMPVPAPATANLLKGIPLYSGEVNGELCTPTGAALLTHFADEFGSMPEMRVDQVGYGMGIRKFSQPNCVRAFLGEVDVKQNGEILELVCNIDDMTPEAVAFASSRLLEAGALDVYLLPGTMKKGRPGWVLTVLCHPEQEARMAHHILRETTTNGLRVHRCGKYFLEPGQETVQTDFGTARVKTGRKYGIEHVKPEFEDAAHLAREQGLPYETVFREILKKWK